MGNEKGELTKVHAPGKKRIYLTHCSAKKDSFLENTKRKVTPDQLYTATPTRRFMERCKKIGVEWAIFSDLYGIWLPNEEHEWYEKDPDTVTREEFNKLLADFDNKLNEYTEIWFYYNPGHFHPLYKKLLSQSRLKERIRLFTHLREIAKG